MDAILASAHPSSTGTSAGNAHQPRRTTHIPAPGGSYRVDLPGSRLGFTPPPAMVHIRFVAPGPGALGNQDDAALAPSDGDAPSGTPTATTLQVRVAAAAMVPTLRWLAVYSPASVHVPSGLAPSEASATFSPVPTVWASLLATVSIQAMELAPDGSATLFVDGTASQIARLGEMLGAPGMVARSRPSRAASEPRLTAAQAATLAKAVALGYYDIPRRADLRTIARHTNRSLASVGEALRRCEEIVVTSFVDRAAVTRWQPAPQATPDNGPAAAPLEQGGHAQQVQEAVLAIDAF